MRKRSRGATALSVVSVLVGLYSQFAAMALIIAASAFAPRGATDASLVFALGLVFLALMILAYAAAFGFWAGHAWAWAAGLTVFGTLMAASVVLTLASANLVSAVLPIVGGAIGIWYLSRPATKAEVTRTSAPATVGEAATTTSLEAPQVAR